MSTARSALLGLLAAVSGFVINVLTPYIPVEGPYPRWLIPAAGAAALTVVVVSMAILQREPGGKSKARDELLAQLIGHREALAQLEARCRAHDRWTTGCVEAWGRHQREIELLKDTLRKLDLKVTDARVDTAPAPGVGCLMRAALLAKNATALLVLPLVAFFAGFAAADVAQVPFHASPRIAMAPVTHTPQWFSSASPATTGFVVTAKEMPPTSKLPPATAPYQPTALEAATLSPQVAAMPTEPPRSATASPARTLPAQPLPPTLLLPTATSAPPKPTPTPAFAAIVPDMSGGTYFVGQESSIQLRWLPIGQPLAADEYYLVTMRFEHEGAEWRDFQWTKEPGLRVPTYLYDLLGGNREVRWQVELVRLLRGAAEGDPEGRVRALAAMPAQLVFEWARPQIAAPPATESAATHQAPPPLPATPTP